MFPWQGEFSTRDVFLTITSAAAKFLFYLFIILFQYHAIIFLQEIWASIIFLSHKFLLRSMLCRFQTMSRVGLGRFGSHGFWNLYQCLSVFHWMHRCQRLLLSPLAYDAIFQNTHKGALSCECVSIHCLKRRNILCHDDADSTPC